jgi:hypothetical protein
MKQQQQPYTYSKDRFINKDLSELQKANHNPIYGYQHLPLLPLERAVQKVISLVPGLADYVVKAKQNCNRNTTVLTLDESAAIFLYSMSTPFFSRLNEVLRAENRHELKPWFSFLKLFIYALEKLPSLELVVWRGVSGNIGSGYIKNDVCTWWSVNSCSTDLNVVQSYLCDNSTLFAIKSHHAKDISSFSLFETEHEVVLLPGTRLHVQSNALDFQGRLFIVYLEEIFPSIQEVPE